MTLREEFEKALVKEWPITIMEGISVNTRGTNLIALWAAQWAMERCAIRAEEYDSGSRIADEIRILGRSLNEGKQ